MTRSDRSARTASFVALACCAGVGFGCSGVKEAPPGGGGIVVVPGADAASDARPQGDVTHDTSDARPTTDVTPVSCVEGSVDLLLMVDNSNSMGDNQANFARNASLFIDALVSPPVDPMTMRPRYPAVRSLHVGVVSSDLGTPGSLVPSCADANVGDDGRLNPIRSGAALRAHPPWLTAPPGRRPALCRNDPNQFPAFLTFDAMSTSASEFRDALVCTAYLSLGGCGLEQQLESVYRALVVHDARTTAGNTDPNAGFLRDDAYLGIVMLTDEEDGSVRDCRYAEPGVACQDATRVYDLAAPGWASNDLNLRFYMYAPGSSQDPTWPLDRYIDPRDPSRGLPGLKPGHPERVFFSAIVGVPINLPMRAGPSGPSLDWDALLGRMPDGSDGYTGMSPEGPVSMRQRNMDPACSTRVVPACRREGSTVATTCDAAAQYFAWPSRRIAQVARRFEETWGTGAITSICRNDYSAALARLVTRPVCADTPDASQGDAAVDVATDL